MATKLGSLLIELGLDSAKFRSGTRQAQREMSTFQRGMAGSANLVKGALVGMVSALSVDMFATAIKNGLDYAASLGEVSKQLGVTTNTLQEYRYAATQVGVTQEEMEAGLARLTRTLGTSPEKFEALGIAIRGANGEIEDAGEILPRIAEAYRNAGSEAERARILYELFGRTGQKFAPLFAEGAQGINNLRDAAHRLGIVLSSEQIAKADETADKLEAVRTVLNAKIAGTVADNADAIVAFANAVGEAADNVLALARSAQAIESAWGGGIMGKLANIVRWSGPGLLVRGAQYSLQNNGDPADLFGLRPLPAPAARPATGPAAPVATARPSSNGALLLRRRNFIDDLADQGLNGTAAIETQAVATAARTATPALRAMSDEVASLLDRLNPVAAAQRELAANTELLNRALRDGQITSQQHATAVAQLRREYGVAGEGLIDWADVIGDVGGASADAAARINDATWAVDSLADSIEASAERSAEAAARQQQSLFDMLGSIRNFANSLKSGDILGVVEGVLGILESIGGMTGGFNIGPMRFGSGASSRIPRFAGGTNFAPGGLAWVGERGAELVNLPRGASVTPNHALKGLSGSQVQIVPSPYFDVVVDGRVMRAAPGIAAAGSQGAQVAMARRGTRRLA